MELNIFNWFVRNLHVVCILNFQTSINSSVIEAYSHERNNLLLIWERSAQEKQFYFWKDNLLTWCLCFPKLCMCHHTDPGPLTEPWLWCNRGPLYYVSVPVLYLCLHSLLCEFFEQLIVSVKNIRTQWIFQYFSLATP